MDKRSLTERDICTKFILPAVKRAGWDEMVQVREEVYFTKGRIIVRGKLVTRGKAKKWRTGFYQIAIAAKVPMVVGFMDYGRKTGGLGPLIWPTGDFRADMMKVLEIYKSCIPKFPERAVSSIDDIVGTEDEGARG